MSTLRLAIEGAAGRMGQTLIRCANRMDGMTVAAGRERKGHPAVGRDAGLIAGTDALDVPIVDAETYPCEIDVAIDFTFHEAAPATLHRAVSAGHAVVLGTTGLTEDEARCVTEASAHIPIVWAPNMSLGINLLLDLVERAAALLGNDYDIELVEMHHRHKQDAPSGTAMALAESAARGRNVALDDVARYGRHGMTGGRPAGEIGMHAVRGGDVVGDHTVMFAADGERIEIAHRATNRECFAMGALKAAGWVFGRSAGRYDMRDVLGLRS